MGIVALYLYALTLFGFNLASSCIILKHHLRLLAFSGLACLRLCAAEPVPDLQSHDSCWHFPNSGISVPGHSRLRSSMLTSGGRSMHIIWKVCT